MSKSTIGQYTLLETLGTGASAKVKLCQDPNGNQYAIKIFDLSNPRFTAKAMDYLEKEIQVYQMMNHANIIQLIEAKMNAVKVKPDGQEKNVAFIVLELVTGGELFDFVALKNFSEPISRFYFRQLMQALHYVHTMGACHRDLKPENILLDKEFNIKIADFGFAAPIQGRDGSGFLSTYLGTQSYMAPEILEGQSYQGHVVDLFAAGVILFTIHAGHPPFNAALQKDSFYKLLAMNRADLFWKTHSRNKPEGFFSEEFKDLITNMLQVMPHQRLSLAEIVGHPWMQGPIAEVADVQQEFSQRFEQIKLKQDQEAQKNQDIAALKQKNENPDKKIFRVAHIGNKIYLNFNPDVQNQEEVLAEAQANEEQKESGAKIICLALKEYKPKINKTTVLFSSWKPEDILARVVALLADREIEPQISDKKWRLTFDLVQELNNEEKEAGQQPQKCSVQMDLLRVPTGQLAQAQQEKGEVIAVEFSRVGGGSGELFQNKFMALRPDLNQISDAQVLQ